jgi:hypothetical protein
VPLVIFSIHDNNIFFLVLCSKVLLSKFSDCWLNTLFDTLPLLRSCSKGDSADKHLNVYSFTIAMRNEYFVVTLLSGYIL